MSMIYSKPFKTPAELITKLKSQNLLISLVPIVPDGNTYLNPLHVRVYLSMHSKAGALERESEKLDFLKGYKINVFRQRNF